MQRSLSVMQNTVGHLKLLNLAYSAVLMAARKCALFTDPSPQLTKLTKFRGNGVSTPKCRANPAPIARPTAGGPVVCSVVLCCVAHMIDILIVHVRKEKIKLIK